MPDRFHPVALVSGAAEGLGAAFARSLARRGCDLVLLDRKGPELEAVSAELRATFAVNVRPLVEDLADPSSAHRVEVACRSLDLGLVVLNAAEARVGDVVATPFADACRVIDTNIKGSLGLVCAVVPGMQARRRGAVLIVGSNAGLIGHTRTAVYGATKAFGVRLGESLFAELAPFGVDVRVACPGAVSTPAFARSGARVWAPLVAPPTVVAEQALASFDAPGPVVVLGRSNRALMAGLRALPRRLAVRLLDRVMRATYPEG
ncbi:MAG: SDR family NAD(P)-dependent oxidoreductase [Myxococcales bacterium]|nr:SDR family NAD(P)-dependent oxidoreductase [Myxococcales bacterium]